MSERVVRWAGIVVAVAAAMLLATVSSFLVPLRIGTVHFPLAIVVAVAGSVAVIRYARWVGGGSVLGVLLPALAWLGVVITLATPTTEGDLVVVDNWVSLGMLLAGAGAMTVSVVVGLNAPLGTRAKPPPAR